MSGQGTRFRSAIWDTRFGPLHSNYYPLLSTGVHSLSLSHTHTQTPLPAITREMAPNGGWWRWWHQQHPTLQRSVRGFSRGVRIACFVVFLESEFLEHIWVGFRG